jgi:creatinine amidohydrolase/Fe(II)-dependent formamide hydrolase-like protein
MYHTRALNEARRILVDENTAEVLCLGFTNDPALTEACYRDGVKQFYKSPQPDREGHGGESETAVALCAFPETVRQELIPQLEPNFDYDVDAFRNETKDYWSLSGGRGYFGWPRAATAETGKQLIAVRGKNIAQVILRAWGTPNRTNRTK